MENNYFSLIPKGELTDILSTLQSFTELPIQLIGRRGNVIMTFGDGAKYCTLLNSTGVTGNACAGAHLKAGEHALKLGEAYIFSCHASLNHIAFPLIHQHELLATIIVGPFLMDKPDSTVVSAAAEKYALQPSMLLDLYDELAGIKILSPAKVNDLKKLLEHLLMPLIPAERALLLDRQKKLYQQSRINETIQMYKEQKRSDTKSGFIEQERQLLAKAKIGDVDETKRILNEILGQVLFSEGGRLSAVRIRALELSTLLSRVALDGGAGADIMRNLSEKYADRLESSKDIEDICHLLQEMIDAFMNLMFFQKDKGDLRIRRAIKYIASNYNNRISLSNAAEHVGLSDNYFSALFKKTVGMSFSDFLSHVRVEESKQLLISTDYSMAQIAVAVGFPDQSYFCKVFKTVTGFTPGSFRY